VNAIKNYTKVHDEILQEVYAKAIKEFIDSFKNIAPGEHHPRKLWNSQTNCHALYPLLN
jgi:hypothetical protein